MTTEGNLKKHVTLFDPFKWMFYYFGDISREEVNRLLSENDLEPGTFILRASSTQIGGFSLSVKTDNNGINGIRNYRIEKKENENGEIRYQIGESEQFKDMGSLMRYYKYQTLYKVALKKSYPKKCLEKVIGLYRFNGERRTDLPFEKAELLYVVDNSDSQWWVARNAMDVYGQIPYNFVKKYIRGEDINLYIKNNPIQPTINTIQSKSKTSTRSSLMSDIKRLSSHSSNEHPQTIKNRQKNSFKEMGNIIFPVWVRVIKNRTPNIYDKGAFKLVKGEFIQMTGTLGNGIAEGILNGVVGTFPLVNIEITNKKC
ncbi:Adapter molecule Crk [Strongyloides ratti]|uniref:Adapter molecule Crk n=1 Tax=Strongyloides ratti TaxID=34506 RepID=A0A090KS15_STRRB|nr:Adapter molecule Crk [Strongyloides ratti]CEF60290.1 Adapter molecule Crk [Strongyloides ratti]